jgi:hypothetical protein
MINFQCKMAKPLGLFRQPLKFGAVVSLHSLLFAVLARDDSAAFLRFAAAISGKKTKSQTEEFRLVLTHS